MTNTANINTMKDKITLALLTFLLALFASAAFQSAALAETSSSPATSEDSIQAGPPQQKTARQPADVVRNKGSQQTQEGSFQAQGTYMGTSGTPGAHTWRRIQGQAYFNGSINWLGWDGSTIYRSPSYAGTQVITETHKIYKYNKSTGQWVHVANHTGSASVPAGYHSQVNAGYYTNPSVAQEFYFVDIVMTWKTTGGALIAKTTIRTNNSTDYVCRTSRGTCFTGGTEGSLVYLSLYA